MNDMNDNYNYEFNYDTDFNNSTGNLNQNHFVPTMCIIIILVLSFGSQCLKFKFLKSSNIKKIKYEKINDNLLNECSICLTEFVNSDNLIILPCNHYYHEACVTKWFEKEKTCPICRINLNN